MKRFFFILSFLSVVGFASANAQCAKSASAGKSCCSGKTAMVKSNHEAEAKAASMDKTIVASIEDGVTTYQRKVENKRKVSYVDVCYDSTTGKFVDASTCTDKPGCEKASAKATSSKGKACAGSAKGGACCQKGATSENTTGKQMDKM
ncbi:MAG TPA: hypothetical protein PK076_13410 [Saprospiraceae bacterium]|nr:hypothetical protein [Saprospiraceae bacterium]HQW57125.1 hypothetical protein [Saprospiraceae bacterium]